MVLLDRLVAELLVLLLLGRVKEGRVEDLLLDLDMDLELLLDLGEQLLPPGRGPFGGLFQLPEQLPDLVVILLQQCDGIRIRALPRSCQDVLLVWD